MKLDGKIEESRNAINLIQKIKTLSAQKQKIKNRFNVFLVIAETGKEAKRSAP